MRLIVGIVLMTGCGFDGQPDPFHPSPAVFHAFEARQLARWAARKPSCAAYVYDRRPTDASGVVTVQIVDDRPLWRWYVSATEATKVEWVERGDEVGTHPDAPPASTVEQLWDECATIVGTGTLLASPLTSSEEGVPTSCIPMSGVQGLSLEGFNCKQVEPPAGLP